MSDHHPYRLATYNFELTLPSAPDGPTDQPVKFNFARQVNVVSSEESLADEAKLEFKRWCDKHLKVSVETKLIGTMGESLITTATTARAGGSTPRPGGR